MPIPIGHKAIGLATYDLGLMNQYNINPWKLLLTIIVLSSLPDVDVIIGLIFHGNGNFFHNGFQCPKCGHNNAWFIRTRKVFDCRGCRAKIGLTAGTVFHITRTPLIKLYWLIYPMAMDKVGVSIF